MASLVKRALSDGSTAYLVRFRTVDGRQRSAQFARKRDADAFAAKIETDRRTGQFVDPRLGKITFGEWVGEWWPTVTHLRASTSERDALYMRRHVIPTFGPVPLASIDRTSIRRWIATLTQDPEKDLAPATVHKICQVFNKALKAAQEDKLIAVNPAERITLPKIERKEMRCLNREEVFRLAAAIDQRYRAFVLLGAFGGLRLGELLALRVGAVDIANQRVRITETLVDLNGHLSFGPPKTRASVRNVSLPRFVLDSLDLTAKASDALVIEAPDGGPVRVSTWRRRFWAPAVASAGVTPLRIHDLRHTAVSLWIAAGGNPKQIAARAGHTSVAVVFDRYGHLYEEHDASLVAALEAMQH